MIKCLRTPSSNNTLLTEIQTWFSALSQSGEVLFFRIVSSLTHSAEVLKVLLIKSTAPYLVSPYHPGLNEDDSFGICESLTCLPTARGPEKGYNSNGGHDGVIGRNVGNILNIQFRHFEKNFNFDPLFQNLKQPNCYLFPMPHELCIIVDLLLLLFVVLNGVIIVCSLITT